jgi:hypothetical protein
MTMEWTTGTTAFLDNMIPTREAPMVKIRSSSVIEIVKIGDDYYLGRVDGCSFKPKHHPLSLIELQVFLQENDWIDVVRAD